MHLCPGCEAAKQLSLGLAAARSDVLDRKTVCYEPILLVDSPPDSPISKKATWCCQRWEGPPSRGREQEHCALFYKQLPVLKVLCFLSVPPGIQNHRNGQNEIFHRLSCKSALQLSKTTKPAVMNDMPASQRFGNTLLLNRDGLPVDLLSKFFCFYLLLPLIIIHLCFTRVTNLY